MKKIVIILAILFVYSALASARWQGDKWIPDTPQQKVAQKKIAIKQRGDYAAEFERELLSKGMDVDITASGPEKKTIKIKYILINKPFVYKMTIEGKMMERLDGMGFTKAILTDGYDKTWDFDIKKFLSPTK